MLIETHTFCWWSYISCPTVSIPASSALINSSYLFTNFWKWFVLNEELSTIERRPFSDSRAESPLQNELELELTELLAQNTEQNINYRFLQISKHIWIGRLISAWCCNTMRSVRQSFQMSKPARIFDVTVCVQKKEHMESSWVTMSARWRIEESHFGIISK